MNADTLLLRQAHPNFMKGEEITSQVFMPFPRDEGQLSVYNGDAITAQASHMHFTQTLGYQSHSVWAVTHAESLQEGVPGNSDPKPDFPSHAILRFSEQPETNWRKVAKKLKILALSRGVLFIPAQTE